MARDRDQFVHAKSTKGGGATRSTTNKKGTPAGGTGYRFPALALLELSGVAAGLAVVDAMVKRSPIAMLKMGTVHPGRFLIMIGGSVASVAEAYDEGSQRGGEQLLDRIVLPDIHPRVLDAALGTLVEPAGEALGILEAKHTASLLGAIDAAVKACAITVTQIRLADDLGGKAFALLHGSLADLEAALDIGEQLLGPRMLEARALLPRLDDTLREILSLGSGFASCGLSSPAGAEEIPEPGGDD
jgi:microcompartment protein CcmL/EutN